MFTSTKGYFSPGPNVISFIIHFCLDFGVVFGGVVDVETAISEEGDEMDEEV